MPKSRAERVHGRHLARTGSESKLKRAGRNPLRATARSKRKRQAHVRVPIEEYRELLAARDAIEHERILNDSKTKWIDADDAAKRFAVDRIAEARKKAGLTQAQLAAKLKMPQSQVSRIERNPDRSTVRTLKKIAAALGVDITALVG